MSEKNKDNLNNTMRTGSAGEQPVITDSTESDGTLITDSTDTGGGISTKDKAEPKAPAGFKQKLIAYLKSCPKRYFITAFSGMTIGLFCTLIAGTIIENLGRVFQVWALPIYEFLFATGNMAKILMGAGIGAGVAYSLKAPKMVIVSAIAAGFLGAFAGTFLTTGFTGFTPGAGVNPGNPVNSYLCALAATEIGILLSGKTKLDILVVPLSCIIFAGLIAVTLGRPVDWLIGKIGSGIDMAAGAQPFLMSVIVALVMGLLLTLPTSSAAIGISVGLKGLAAGAAVAGCCSHMVGFAVASFRENKYSGLVAQGLGTSMLQIPNLTRRPQILIPPVIASVICGPIATLVFGLVCDPAGSGMGTAGLVGVINTIFVSLEAQVPVYKIALGIAVSLIILPAVISLGVSELMRKKGWIKFGDMKIES